MSGNRHRRCTTQVLVRDIPILTTLTGPSVRSLSDLTLTYCGKAGLGQISRSFTLNRPTIRLKRSKNLTPTGFPSLRSVKSDRLLGNL